MAECPSCKNKMQLRRLRMFDIEFEMCQPCRILELKKEVRPIDRKGKITFNAYERFDTTLAAASSPKFNILIWGPNPNDEKEGKKRLEIQDSLSKQHVAKLSEDFEEISDASGEFSELVQSSNWADLVILLACSPGSFTEGGSFTSSLGNRLIVWIREDHKDSYFHQGFRDNLEAGGAKIEYYNDVDLEVCVLRTASEIWVKKMVDRRRLKEARILNLSKQDLHEGAL